MDWLDYHIIEVTEGAGGKLQNTRHVQRVLLCMLLDKAALTFHLVAKWQEGVYSERADAFRRTVVAR